MSELRPNMSELADAIDRTASEGLCAWPSFDADDADRCVVMLADHLRSLLAAHEVEIIARAKRKQMEADCRAVCPSCWHGHAAYHQVRAADVWYSHVRDGSAICAASPIRSAWAKAHPEENDV